MSEFVITDLASKYDANGGHCKTGHPGLSAHAKQNDYSGDQGRKEMFDLTTQSTHSDSESENPLPPLHGLFFLISSKGSCIGIILQT